MRFFLLMALVTAPAGAQMVQPMPHGTIVQSPAASPTSATPTPNSTSTPTAPAPSSSTGVPPTPTPAFPGLPVPQTSSGLPSGTPPQPLTQDLRTPISLTPSQVADLQTRLAAGGFYRGPIDGNLNASTRSAISAYQEATALPVTGRPDAATTGAIGVTSAATAAKEFGTPFPLTPSSDATIFVQP